MLRALCTAAVVVAVAACPPSPAGDAPPRENGVDAGNPPAGQPAASQRPPHPNMATAAWGQRVVEDKVAAVPPGLAGTEAATLEALHELAPGSEARAAELAAAWFKAAASNVERSKAAALLAAALVLDPAVDGYKERLTDAFGVAAYAATLDVSDPLAQAARALVGAAGGAVEQARRLAELVANTPKLPEEPRTWLALSRKLANDRGDDMIADLRIALSARPASSRARALLAETYLDLGLYPEAIAVTQPPEAKVTKGSKAPKDGSDDVVPWLAAIRGRALVLDGKADEGIPLLQAAERKLDEGRRGDALYWLGRSLTQDADSPATEVEALAATLQARPGFAREAAVLSALLAQKRGDYQKAKALLEPIVRGPPSLPVDADAAWLLVDACAGLGDLACVDKVGRRGLAIDGDEARLQHARAAAVLVGKASADASQALTDAFRASPFDEGLAKKVGEPVVPGGGAAAARVRAARKALVRRAPLVLGTALAPLKDTATCRVCRALDAAAAEGIDATKRAAAAMAGQGPALALSDLLRVVDALGAAPTPESEKALAKLAGDTREPVVRALAQAREDHRDPDARRRRDAEDHGHGHGDVAPSPGAPPPKGAP